VDDYIDEVAKRTGHKPSKVSKVINTAANYVRACMQNPERPRIHWEELFHIELMEYKLIRLQQLRDAGMLKYKWTDRTMANVDYLRDLVKKYRNAGQKNREKNEHYRANKRFISALGRRAESGLREDTEGERGKTKGSREL